MVLNTNGRVGIGTTSPARNFHVGGDAEFDNRVYADNGVHVRGDWLRVNGNNGVYFENRGGGWHMTDSTWLRAYNNKGIYTGGNIRADGRIYVDNGTNYPLIHLELMALFRLMVVVKETGKVIVLMGGTCLCQMMTILWAFITTLIIAG